MAGFGATYRADDVNLGELAAIKEDLPGESATRKRGSKVSRCRRTERADVGSITHRRSSPCQGQPPCLFSLPAACSSV